MRGTLTEDARLALIEKEGSPAKAAQTIKDIASWSLSKADKIMRGSYPSKITPLEGNAVAKFLKWPLERVFKPSVKRSKAS